MDPKVADAVTKYYKLKALYDDKINKQKQTILKSQSLSKKGKRNRFLLLKYSCINCKQEGGTVFENKNGTLKAVCGNTDKPCKLHIEINKGTYANILDLETYYLNLIENIKSEIIQTKLNYLFQFTSEEESVKQFEKLRDNLKKISLLQVDILKKYNSIFNKETELVKYNRDLILQIEENKELGKLYKAEQRDQLLVDLINNYLTVIQPIEKKINELKYVKRFVNKVEEREKTIDEFITFDYYLSDLEKLTLDSKKPEVIKFTK
jgi:hypothetical protein